MPSLSPSKSKGALAGLMSAMTGGRSSPRPAKGKKGRNSGRVGVVAFIVALTAIVALVVVLRSVLGPAGPQAGTPLRRSAATEVADTVAATKLADTVAATKLADTVAATELADSAAATAEDSAITSDVDGVEDVVKDAIHQKDEAKPEAEEIGHAWEQAKDDMFKAEHVAKQAAHKEQHEKNAEIMRQRLDPRMAKDDFPEEDKEEANVEKAKYGRQGHVIPDHVQGPLRDAVQDGAHPLREAARKAADRDMDAHLQVAHGNKYDPAITEKLKRGGDAHSAMRPTAKYHPNHIARLRGQKRDVPHDDTSKASDAEPEVTQEAQPEVTQEAQPEVTEGGQSEVTEVAEA